MEWNGRGIARELARRYRAHPDLTAAAGTMVAAAGLIALGLTGLWSGASWAPDVSPWWHLLPVLAGCLAMLVKRRRPLGALLAGVVFGAVDVWLGGSLGMLLVFFDLLYSAVLYGAARRVRILLAVIVAAVVSAFVGPLVAGQELQPAVLSALQAFVLLGTPYWWGMSVRRSRELATLSEARARDAERLAGLLRDEAVREERGRMARDLHDVIAGNLSAIAINAEAALSSAPSEERDRAALRAVRAASTDGLDEMRSMILVLRSGDDPLAAPPRLAELPDLLARTPGTTRVTGAMPAVPTAIDQALARVVGESLANAARHAPGAEVEIAFADAAGEVAVTIVSRGGAGASPAVGTGHGIDLIRERAERLGGTLEAGPVKDGWRVSARIPRSAS